MTPTEKATKAFDEGIEWGLALIAMRLGEEKLPSYELRAAASEARKAIWKAQSEYRYFKRIADGEAPEDARQPDLPHTGPSQAELDAQDARDAEAGRQKVAEQQAQADAFGDIPDEGQGEEPDAELDQVEGELATELDRVLVDGEALHAHAERSGSVLLINVGSPYGAVDATTWEIVREAPRVLGALRQLPDGAGAEAVRAALCGLEETVVEELAPGCEDDADCPPGGCGAEGCSGPAVADDLVDADAPPAGTCTCGLAGTCDWCVELDRREAEAEHAALRALNPPAEEEPRAWREARRQIIEAIIRAHAEAVKCEQVYAEGDALMARLGRGMNFVALPVDDALRVLGECATKGSEKTWTAIETWSEGKAQGEAPADLPRKAPAKKRKTRAEADGDDVVVGGKS